jgi:rRNA maturation protein Nop10
MNAFNNWQISVFMWVCIMEEARCAQCGKPFNNTQKTKFCCQECYQDYLIEMKKRLREKRILEGVV